MKKYTIAIVFLILSIITYATYHIIGQNIAEDGTLKEPFILIPLTYSFFGISLVSFIVVLSKNQLKK